MTNIILFALKYMDKTYRRLTIYRI